MVSAHGAVAKCEDHQEAVGQGEFCHAGGFNPGTSHFLSHTHTSSEYPQGCRFYRSLAGQQDFWARFWGCRAEEAGAVHEARGTCAEEQDEVIFYSAPCWWKLSRAVDPGRAGI